MEQLNEVLNSISELVKIDSSRAPAKGNMPFGEGAYLCLTKFLSLAESFGFETRNYDNYIGEVVFGEGEEFAVLAHLDVVPAGSGWTRNPFGGEIENGRVWGRGTVDDKGPAVCALYALKALKESGFTPKKKIKLIVGCNEEDGWACIEHYKKCTTMPRVGFSPDASFPVIYAEKGIAHLLFRFPVKNAPFTAFSGGSSANMVCAFCSAAPISLREESAKKHGLSYENGVLTSVGKSAHGSTPEQGKNAVAPLLSYFGEENAEMKHIYDCLFGDIYGLKKLKDETGSLTLSPDVVSYENGVLKILCDIRYPATLDFSAVSALADKFGAPYEIVHHQLPLMQDKNGKLVQTLLSVYEAHTGRKAEPIAIGGGTYARALECGVGFGPEEEDDEPVVHQADEYIAIDRVELLLAVYEEALKKLCG